MSDSLAVQLAQAFVGLKSEFEEAIAASCPVPLFVSDSTGKWIYTNRCLQLLLAAPSSELLGDAWVKCIHKAHAAQTTEDWLAYTSGKSDSVSMKIHYAARDGRLGCAYIRASRSKSGNHVGFVIPACDEPNNCPLHGFLLRNVEYGCGHCS